MATMRDIPGTTEWIKAGGKSNTEQPAQQPEQKPEENKKDTQTTE